MVVFGKIVIAVVVVLAAILASVTYDPTSTGNFALTISAQLSYLKPGMVVAFFIGIFWRKVHPKTAVITMLIAPFFAVGIEFFYNHFLGTNQSVAALFGVKLNFMHRVLLTTIFCAVLQVVLSKLWTKTDTQFKGIDLTIPPQNHILRNFGWFLLMQIPLILLANFVVSPQIVAIPAGICTYVFLQFIVKQDPDNLYPFWQDDRTYAQLLAAITVSILYYFA